ncbi:hypothetical protein VTL71DRAFT_4981 [Oculimacula yallundae]|uniref:Uncharacterized protein n=1 Tax=Oculimacula yallundae TaxID=86028 RepID=A0ABR4C4P6_9HELO
MRFTHSLASFLLACASLGSSTPTIVPFEEYTVSEVQWIGEFQGQAYNVSGEVQDVHAHLLSIDPSYILPDHSEVGKPILEARWDNHYLCCPVAGENFHWANRDAIKDGMKYLRNLNTNLVVAGNTCSQFSCSWDAAIWCCNQVYFPVHT